MRFMFMVLLFEMEISLLGLRYASMCRNKDKRMKITSHFRVLYRSNINAYKQTNTQIYTKCKCYSWQIQFKDEKKNRKT